jgi:hypothetical protein
MSARSTPSHSPMSGANSPNMPPSSPLKIRSSASACSFEASSFTTMPSFRLPALMFDGAI